MWNRRGTAHPGELLVGIKNRFDDAPGVIDWTQTSYCARDTASLWDGEPPAADLFGILAPRPLIAMRQWTVFYSNVVSSPRGLLAEVLSFLVATAMAVYDVESRVVCRLRKRLPIHPKPPNGVKSSSLPYKRIGG